MCTINMTFEVPDSRAIDIEASEQLVKETVDVKEHSEWVKSMAKYRRLEPIDCKQELLDSLDERFK